MGEGKGGMFQENSTETCILSSVKQMRQVLGPGALGRPCDILLDAHLFHFYDHIDIINKLYISVFICNCSSSALIRIIMPTSLPLPVQDSTMPFETGHISYHQMGRGQSTQ